MNTTRKIIGSMLTAALVIASISTGVSAGKYVVDDASLKDVKINDSAFPDKTFRDYISSTFDTNKDGTLSVSEYSYIREMDVSGKGISNLKGIEYFQDLFTLKCNNNSLKSLDLSKNYNLQYLDCSKNSISTLEIGTMPLIKRAYDRGSKSEKNGVVTYTAYYGPKDASDDGNMYLICDSSTNVTIDTDVGWLRGAKGWWFRTADGSSIKNCGKQIGGEWYYFDSEGYLVQEKWVKSGGRWFYFESDSMIVTGWMNRGGKYYYFSGKDWKESGTQTDSGMQIGLQRVYSNGWKWFYFDNDGAMHKGWQEVNGKWYYFGSNGVIQTGWCKIKGEWYYLLPADAGKEVEPSKNGYMLTGWQKINNIWYYFKSSGAMATGWQSIGGKWYYFNPKGGAMITGWRLVDGDWYYFNDSGAMMTGWFQLSGKWYHANSSGAMNTEWVKLNGKIYYFDPDTCVMNSGHEYFILGGFFTFDNDGVCTNPPEYLL